jgi:hypothetical protein
MSARLARKPLSGGGGDANLRRWLEYVAQTAIDMLDDLDAASAEREDDERECDGEAA